jgi:hypothetical protein
MVAKVARALFGIIALSSCGSSRSDGANDPDRAADAGAPVPAPFTLTAIDRARIGSKSDAPNFQKAKGEIDVAGGPFADVKLVVDLASTCFPFEQWKSDPPPAGQSYPASCDAFDRNFEVALFDPAAPDAPGLELVHAITPFGGPLHLEVDVTDLFQTLRGKRRVEVTIPTYSDAAGKITGSNGGWTVSARFEVTPGDAPRKVLAVVPLLYTSLTKGGAEQAFPFRLPDGTKHARLEYLASGHGGAQADMACIGPADEFCERRHTLTADGAPILAAKPLWRSDCDKLCTIVKGGPFGSYCKENPCGAPSSVRAPRANWCPGSVTPALTFEPERFAAPGDHTLGITIDTIADKASWRVSAKVYAYAEAP